MDLLIAAVWPLLGGIVVGAALHACPWFIRLLRSWVLHPVMFPTDWRTIEAAMNGESLPAKWFARFIPE